MQSVMLEALAVVSGWYQVYNYHKYPSDILYIHPSDEFSIQDRTSGAASSAHRMVTPEGITVNQFGIYDYIYTSLLSLIIYYSDIIIHSLFAYNNFVR